LVNGMSGVDFGRLPRPVADDHPEFVELYDAAWRIAARHIARHRNGREFMDVAWGRPGQLWEWVWDSCFVALYCRYAPEQYPGMASLDNFYELQREDGYISMTYDMNTGEEPYPDRINPPLFAWVEWEYFLATGDDSRFARVIPHIERLMGWIDANRRTPAWRKDEQPVLYYFRDCGSSGMDDSPRTPRHPEAGRYFEWIDLSCQMALSFRCLARMHAALGDAERAGRWQARAQELGGEINRRLWCPRTRFYYDRNLSRRLVNTKTAASFWPLLAGICDEAQKDALVEHVRNPAEFGRPIPAPTLSADDPNYSEDGAYWVGGVWPPTNYMIARGLMTAGRGDAAHELAVKYLAGLARTWAAVEPHTIWECQCPEADRPGQRPYEREWVKPEFVGWGGIGPISMLIENVLGIDVNAPERRVEWTIRLTGRHGIEGLSMGGAGRVSLMCAPRESADAPARVEASAEKDLEIAVRCGGRRAVLRPLAGRKTEATV